VPLQESRERQTTGTEETVEVQESRERQVAGALTPELHTSSSLQLGGTEAAVAAQPSSSSQPRGTFRVEEVQVSRESQRPTWRAKGSDQGPTHPTASLAHTLQ
jgi:hypothetical protein